MHCRIEGGAVSQLQMIFLRIWNKVTEQNVWGSKYFRAYEKVELKGLKPDTTASAHKQVVGIINREPHTSNRIIRDFYLNAINAAKDSIKLVNPYLTLSPKLKKALRKAAERGVKVEIMVSLRSDIPLTPDCVFYNVHKLMKHGCHIYLYRPGFHHTKVIMVDGKFCTVGSANLNARSLRFDYEENAVILDRHVTAELERLFDNDKSDCDILTEDYWEQWRTPWQQFVGWFAHLLTPVL